MDHGAAVKLGAPERYVTGDLSQAERDEFEEHFADCRACMNDVWTASAFAANAKAVFEDRLTRKPEPQRAGWLAWLRLQTAVPAFAAVV
ncbi:MAG TPA: zf-HC2 domain-containing protein, partial [Bryobacteraceae bacterium]